MNHTTQVNEICIVDFMFKCRKLCKVNVTGPILVVECDCGFTSLCYLLFN